MPLNDVKINELLQRWIQDVIPSREEFFSKLKKEKLVIYHGWDPTAPHIHLGHSTNYLLMRLFHKMGHKIILVVGDFTARIGDPSGRTTGRVPLTTDEVKLNYKLYKEQASKILNFNSKENPIEVRYNGDWLSGLVFEELVKISGNFTVQQMIARDMFQKRLKDGNPIGLHEFLYPLMQGYDSVALKADVEIGGNDQLFNMMAGRVLVKNYLNKEKFVVTTKLLVNPKTGNKLMSKSERSYIALNDAPADMYGKVMALPDEVVGECLELCTELSNAEIKEAEKFQEKERKMALAREIVEIYHGEKQSKEAESEFTKRFKEKEMPDNINEVKLIDEEINIVDLLLETGLVSSKGEARRLLAQNGVKIDGEVKNNYKEDIAVKDGIIVQVGKRKFARVRT